MKVLKTGELPPDIFLRLFAEPVGGYAPGLRDANRLFGFLAKVAETLSAAPATGPARGETAVPVHSPINRG